MPRLTGRQLVAMVVAICCAVVLQPVASTAAGTLMTLVDKSDNTRQTRVTSNGGLVTESRPGSIGGQFNYSTSNSSSSWVFPVTGSGPTAVAVTNMQLAAMGDGAVRVLVQAFVRVSGTETCVNLFGKTTTPAGWSAKLFGTFVVPQHDTLQLSLTQPWTVAPASGQPLCWGYRVLASTAAGMATTWTVYAGFTGYRYTF